MGMKRGATEPITLIVNGWDQTQAEWVIVSLKGKKFGTMEKTGEDLTVAYDGETSSVVFTLTQKESVSIDMNQCTIDLNWSIDGVRNGCVPTTISITPTLLTRVVETDG